MAVPHLAEDYVHRRRWARRRRPLDDDRRVALRPTFASPVGIGALLPAFELREAGGRRWTAESFAGARGLLVAFISNRCPFVLRIRPTLVDVARTLQADGIAVLAINANDAAASPAESAASCRRLAGAIGMTIPYLRDETQEVARAFGAHCTPDLFLYGPETNEGRRLYYHGQFDSARPNNDLPVTGEHLTSAVDRLIAGLPAPVIQHPGSGGAISWKSPPRGP